MPLSPGSKIGPYEVTNQIGAGGMGEVYLARDSRLGRDVALKVLPDAVRHDADRLARFEREAQALASLNHPHIAGIYGIENASSGPVLVMEYIAGPTLADRIAQGAVPLDEALPIAREIADALDAAHSRGIVHRDLKPANIKVRPDGSVKVLDFGLAKALSPDGSSSTSDAMNSPTITTPAMTMQGMILGTAAYMSPEQAKGRSVDRRADIWSFGCVLFEMLTGTRAFAGDDVTDTLAAILRGTPDITAAPPQVRRLLAKCFEKDPRNRLRDIGDAFDLIDTAGPPEATAVAPPARNAWLPWSVAALAVILAAVLGMSAAMRPAPSPTTNVQFRVEWPRQPKEMRTDGPNFIEPSPDGKYFAITSDGVLWVRAIDQLAPIKLEQTNGATYPFWAPDGNTIGFFSGGELMSIPRTGGAVQRICPADNARGGTWNADGTIIFSGQGGGDGLSRVSAAGGVPAALTSVPTGHKSSAHRYPQFLPDGRHFIFMYIDPDPKIEGVYAGDLSGAEPRRVLETKLNARFVPLDGTRGHLLFQRKEQVMAQSFDTSTLKVSGETFVVADRVSQGLNSGLGNYSASLTGLLTYGYEVGVPPEVAWFDRQGKRLDAPVPASLDEIESVQFDRKGRIAAAAKPHGAPYQDIWVQLVPGGDFTPLTLGPAPGWQAPAWSPDGSEVAFTTDDLLGQPTYEVRKRHISNGTPPITLYTGLNELMIWSWSPDGKSLAIQDGSDLLLVPAEKPGKATKLDREKDEWLGDGQLSPPDGRWIAYTSASPSLRARVIVRPMTPSTTRWVLTPDGGWQALWRADGKVLFYVGRSYKLHEVNVSVDASGGLSFSGDHELPLTVTDVAPYGYQPTADGQKFLMVTPSLKPVAPANVVLNWRAGSK